MYREPASTDPLGFGDILEAHWLFDVYLRPDAKSLHAQMKGDKVVAYLPRPEPPTSEPQPPKDAIAVSADFSDDYALAFGHTRAAIILTDDCEMETLLGRTDDDGTIRKPRGRILMAAVKRATEDEVRGVYKGNTSMFPLPPDGASFPGGIVDLGRTFTVNTRSLLLAPEYRRVVGLDRDAKVSLSQRWSAYATRHGPIIAEQAALTMARLLTADGDSEQIASLKAGTRPPDPIYLGVAEAVAAALTSAWQLEGPIADDMLASWEDGEGSAPHWRALVAALLSIREAADAALTGLGETPWRPNESDDASPSAG